MGYLSYAKMSHFRHIISMIFSMKINLLMRIFIQTFRYDCLNHLGIVMPYEDNLGQHWLGWYHVCCLMAPSHYLDKCWLIFREVLWHSRDNFTRTVQGIYPWYDFENYDIMIRSASARWQWANGTNVPNMDEENTFNLQSHKVLINSYHKEVARSWMAFQVPYI